MEQGGHQKAISGFILWLLTILGLLIFIVWSGLEEPTLHRFQFTYYPDKYWGVALPALFVMSFIFYVTTYFLMYMRNTKPLTDAFCITDNDTRATSKVTLGSLSEAQASVPPIADIPVPVTSKIFFQPWK